MSAIYLEPDKVPSHLRGGYNGKRVKVVVTETVTIPADAGNWDGGSRDVYIAKRMSDGAAIPLSDQFSAPWDKSRRDQTVALTPQIAVVRHTTSRDVDLGLTFYLHPAAAAPMLPAPMAELSKAEQLVLDYTAGRKSSYNGKDRYQMAADDAGGYQNGYRGTPADFPTRDDWNAAKVALAARGLLNKAGAITPAGRNAAKRI